MAKKKKTDTTTAWTRAGDIGVDSGQVMLIDPCYIEPDFAGDSDDKPALNYAGACKVTLSEKGCGNFGGAAMAFATETYQGDGVYPVYVRRGPNGRVIEMKIVFDTEEGDA